MPRYKVTIDEHATYFTEVEAEDEDAAVAKAEAEFLEVVSCEGFRCEISDRSFEAELV